MIPIYVTDSNKTLELAVKQFFETIPGTFHFLFVEENRQCSTFPQYHPSLELAS
jgi:hypothetical protein